MASIITATTTNGLTQAADNSGVLQLASGAGNLITVPSVTGTMLTNKSVGSVLQVVSTTLTTLVTASSNTWTTITSASITPSSASSRILIFYNMPVATVGQETISRVLRGATVITEYSGGDITQIGWGFIGAGSAGWTGGMMSGSFRDSPSITSSITYNLQAYQEGTTLYVNRTSGTSSSDSAGGVTTITLMEIAA